MLGNQALGQVSLNQHKAHACLLQHIMKNLRCEGKDGVADDVELGGSQHTNPTIRSASQPQPFITPLNKNIHITTTAHKYPVSYASGLRCYKPLYMD